MRKKEYNKVISKHLRKNKNIFAAAIYEKTRHRDYILADSDWLTGALVFFAFCYVTLKRVKNPNFSHEDSDTIELYICLEMASDHCDR